MTILPKFFLKDFLNHLKNKTAWNIFFTEKGFSMGIGSVPVFVMLHDTESSNRTSQVVSLQKGYRKEEVDTKMILGVCDCFNNGYKVGMKILYTDIIKLLLANLTRFHRSCDIMINYSFFGNFCYFNISSSTPNILNLNFHLMISFCVFTGCNLLLSLLE